MILGRLFSLLLITLAFYKADCQSNTQNYSLLKFDKNSTATFLGDTLIIDTLEMYDYSTMIFKSDSYVLVNHGFIGESVKLIAHGHDGSRGSYRKNGSSGRDGNSGFDITFVIRFEKLGSLNISTNGGSGGKGGRGWSSNYEPFPGGNGGNGGNAGDIHLIYKTKGLVPIFNKKNRNHSINIIANGGNGGKAGSGGKYGSLGKYGSHGIIGIKGKDGKIKITKL